MLAQIFFALSALMLSHRKNIDQAISQKAEHDCAANAQPSHPPTR
jgi:hypothetical protein